MSSGPRCTAAPMPLRFSLARGSRPDRAHSMQSFQWADRLALNRHRRRLLSLTQEPRLPPGLRVMLHDAQQRAAGVRGHRGTLARVGRTGVCRNAGPQPWLSRYRDVRKLRMRGSTTALRLFSLQVRNRPGSSDGKNEPRGFGCLTTLAAGLAPVAHIVVLAVGSGRAEDASWMTMTAALRTAVEELGPDRATNAPIGPNNASVIAGTW